VSGKKNEILRMSLRRPHIVDLRDRYRCGRIAQATEDEVGRTERLLFGKLEIAFQFGILDESRDGRHDEECR
jgi:hypothetical protein